MDSLTHIVVGAAIGTAVLGRKAGPRAALWGAVCSTLPDLDVLVPYGDPVRDFTYHRAATHSLIWLTLAAPAVAWLVSRLERRSAAGFREWLALAWLALVAHPLLDAFTVYGTQLLLPLSDYPVAIGSVFIIDPLYTLPVLVGTAGALLLHRRDPGGAQRWNAAGLVASSLYLAWTVGAQLHVEGVVSRSVAFAAPAHGRVLVTPTPFNSLLWRVVVMGEDGYGEGYHSLLDDAAPVELVTHPSETGLLQPLQDDWGVRRLAWFSKGFYSLRESAPSLQVAKGSASTLGQVLGVVETAQAGGRDVAGSRRSIVLTDLRMGETPWFAFSFVVGEREGDRVTSVPARQLPMQKLPPDALRQLWRRALGEGSDASRISQRRPQAFAQDPASRS
jgi:inner membrane protein